MTTHVRSADEDLVPFATRLPVSLRRDIEAEADRREVSMNRLIVDLLRGALEVTESVDARVLAAVTASQRIVGTASAEVAHLAEILDGIRQELALAGRHLGAGS